MPYQATWIRLDFHLIQPETGAAMRSGLGAIGSFRVVALVGALVFANLVCLTGVVSTSLVRSQVDRKFGSLRLLMLSTETSICLSSSPDHKRISSLREVSSRAHDFTR